MDASDCMASVCTRGRCGTFMGCHWALISQETQFDDTTIQDLFTDNGHTFDVLTGNGTSGVHTSDMTLLSTHTHIVFHEHDRILSTTERDNLRAWIDGGGRLIVTGYDSLGSPTDSNLAGILNCTSPGDGPFSGSLSVVDASHPIMMGPAQVFSMGETLTSGSTDHDRCTPGTGATRLVEVSGSSKLQITEGVGPGLGMVIYWNGNGVGSSELRDWTGSSGTQPDLQNMFVNVLEYLCSAP